LITHLKHHQINKALWDACIDNSGTGLAYPFSWYLDAVSPGWEALVYGKYEAVMPLPVIKRIVLKWVYQPWFCQQLGVFSVNSQKHVLHQFLEAIPWHYINVCASFNYSNNLTSIKHLKKVNYILPLNRPYSELCSGYSTNTKRNLKKATSLGFQFEANISLNEFIDFENLNQSDIIPLKQQNNASTLITKLIEQKKTSLVGMRNSKGQLICAVCLMQHANRLTYLFASSSAEGKMGQAMFLLIDIIIQQYAGTPYILDFEGSSIQGVARFYTGFGAINQPYYYYTKRPWLNI
jgi:hypothetical protein